MTDVANIISKYINNEELLKEAIFNELKQIEKNGVATKNQIASTIWSFLNLSKQSSVFKSDTYSRILQIANYMTERSKKYKKLFFLILDRADTFKFPDAAALRKEVNSVSNNRYQIERYQQFKQNPEGFSHVLVTLFTRASNPFDLLRIIGLHNVDPNVIFNIIFHIITETQNDYFCSFFPIFPLESILPCIFDGIRENNDQMSYSILYSLIRSGKLKYLNLWNITGKPSVILGQLHWEYSQALHIHSEDLKKVRTTEPTKSKRDSLPKLYIKNEKKYLSSQDQLFNSVFFRLLAVSDPFDFTLFKMISSFDPCLYQPIADKLSNVLFQQFSRDPISFLKSKLNLKYLCSLSSHCTENRLIYGILNYSHLIPPYLFSNFFLPTISTNSCAWQMSIPVFDCLKSHYSMDERYEIYSKFSDNQMSILDSIILIANTIRKMEYIRKRLTTDTYKQYSLKISKLFLRAPKKVSEILLNYFINDRPPIEVPFLAISDLSPLSLDYLLLTTCKKIEDIANYYIISNSQIEIDDNLSDNNIWPIDIATFLGKTFSKHCEVMDLQGYVVFINKGLSQLKIQYVCLLHALIAEMTASNYHGNLTKSEIEIRSSELLLSFIQQMKELEFDSNHKEEHLKRILLNDDLGIQILSNLNQMYQKGIVNNPYLLDIIRFTFISICDFMKTEFVSPIHLVTKYNFSFEAAIRISKGTYSDLYRYKQTELPHELFACFWNTTSSDFHYPEKKFKETKKQYNKFRQFLYQSSQNEQKKRIQQLQNDLKQKISFKKFGKSNITQVYSHFVNQCIIPRMIFSQEDSHFCSLFVYSLAHFTDFNFEIFNFYFTRCLHYLIIAATFEEARCIGYFLSKLLKYNRERYEEVNLHQYLMNKFQLVLTHQSENFEFILMKMIEILDRISQDFPIKSEHEELLFSLLNDIQVDPKSSIAIQKRRYFDKRQENVQKRQNEKQKQLSQDTMQQEIPNDEEEEEEKAELPEQINTQKGHANIQHRLHFTGTSKSPSSQKGVNRLKRTNSDYSPRLNTMNKNTKRTRNKEQSPYNRDRYNNRRYTNHDRNTSHQNNSPKGRQTIVTTYAPAETIESLVYSPAPITSTVGQFYSVPQYSSFYQTPQIIAAPIMNQAQQAEQVQYVIPVNTYQQPQPKQKSYYNNKKRTRK